jgi:hypothetical protein
MMCVQVMADAVLDDGIGHAVDPEGSEYLAEIAQVWKP